MAVVLVGAAATGAAALFADRPAVIGALIGAGLVLVSFGFGALTVNLVAARMPSASLVVAMLTYTLQVIVLAVVFVGLTSSGATDSDVDAGWLGLTAIAGTLTWTFAQIFGATRARQPLYSVDTPSSRSQASNAGEVGGGGTHP